jgi:beta-glucanase (GH16 family)
MCWLTWPAGEYLHPMEPASPPIEAADSSTAKSSACNWTLASLKDAAAEGARNPHLPFSDQKNRGRWVMVPAMSDEFDGATLDLSRWQAGIDGWQGRQPGLFVADNVKQAAGMLSLKMVHQPVPAKYQAAGYRDFTTAAVESRQPVLYGYFEVRAKIMPSAGSSAFWLANVTPKNWNEIDVFEIGGKAPGNPHKIFMDAHVFRRDGKDVKESISGSMITDQDMADGFHVFGMEWSAAAIDTYLDGRHVRHICNTSWHMPLRIILDAETQPSWWGLPSVKDLPSTFEVDYIRVWQHRSAVQ